MFAVILGPDETALRNATKINTPPPYYAWCGHGHVGLKDAEACAESKAKLLHPVGDPDMVVVVTIKTEPKP